MSEYEVLDSGARKQGPGGMMKEATDKPWPTTIDTGFLWRLASHMTKGAKKYSRDNWRNAASVEELDGFRDSAFRHLLQWLQGDLDEDHAMALVANVMMYEATKENACVD